MSRDKEAPGLKSCILYDYQLGALVVVVETLAHASPLSDGVHQGRERSQAENSSHGVCYRIHNPDMKGLVLYF